MMPETRESAGDDQRLDKIISTRAQTSMQHVKAHTAVSLDIPVLDIGRRATEKLHVSNGFPVPSVNSDGGHESVVFFRRPFAMVDAWI